MPPQFLTESASMDVRAKNVEVIEVKERGPQTLEDMIREKARENGLDENEIVFVARCESELNYSAIGDGHLMCASTGNPMRSRGLWQINECGHSEISDKQAFDPIWSTDWAMEVFKKGDNAKEWKRCSRKYAKLAAVL